MTEIKIQFIKTKVEEISKPDIPTNIKCLRVAVSPLNVGDKLNKIYEKVPASTTLKQINIAFFDGAENGIYNDLLDDNKDNFWLSWEKEKVDFLVQGKDKFEKNISDTKAQIRFFPEFSKNLEIFFKPQFVGVVKITSTSQGPTGPQDAPNNQGKIAELQAKISELEEKLRKRPNLSNQTEEEKIKKLKEELNREKEISSLQSQINSLEQKQSQNSNSDDSEQTKKKN